eukprot:Gb_16751 [translate_table: standard]
MKMHHKFSGEVRRWMNWKHGIDKLLYRIPGYPPQAIHPCQCLAMYRQCIANVLPGIDDAWQYIVNALSGIDTDEWPVEGSQEYYTKDCPSQYSKPIAVKNIIKNNKLRDGLSTMVNNTTNARKCASFKGFELNVYSPSASKTSKPITCNNRTLVEDILDLIPGDGLQTGSVVKAPITFGCGKIQTGSFLDGAAPNGLFGLGIGQISVSTILSKSGLIPNSFSMCFQREGRIGRITFGDKGTLDQKETPFIIDQTHSTYNVSVQKFYVGKTLLKTEFNALFDTGTSFTYLADPAYKDLTSNFHLQPKDPPLPVDDTIPFEFCYKTRENQSIDEALKISLNFDGGNNFSIIQPLIFLGDEPGSLAGYCLAVIQNNSLTIIGREFNNSCAKDLL